MEYICKLFSSPITFRVEKGEQNSNYVVWDGNILIGTIAKVDKNWEQIGGREMLSTMITEIGKNIDGAI